MRAGLLSLGLERVEIELDALRAVQLVPQSYELILIDTSLSAMDGLQLLLLLRQQAATTIFVIMGDPGDEASRDPAMQNGADLFLERPGSTEAQQKALAEIAALWQPIAGRESAVDPEPLVRIADVVETSCLSGDSVLLHVRGETESGDIFIHSGDVFHAQYPGKSGAAAFYEMMHWNDGLVRIRTRKIQHLPPRTIELPYRGLLRESAPIDVLPGGDRPPPSEVYVTLAGGTTVDSTFDLLSEAPPWPERDLLEPSRPTQETAPAAVHAHWKIDLTGKLVEGCKGFDPDRCGFITSFIYRELADVAVALEVDYFNHMTLWGPQFQQVLAADNLAVRHALFETARTSEVQRTQYLDWCRESGV